MIRSGISLAAAFGILLFLGIANYSSAQEKKAEEGKKEKQAEGVAKELAPFQGSWKLEKTHADGNVLPSNLFGECTLVVKGSSYSLVRKTNREVRVTGKLVVPPDQPPFKDKEPAPGQANAAELLPVDIIPESEGKDLETQKAVLAVSDGKLFLCSGPPKNSRPKTLNTLAKENVVLMIFNRNQP